MKSVNVLYCLHCGSSDLSIYNWVGSTVAILNCGSCQKDITLTNLTVSPIDLTEKQEKLLDENVIYKGKEIGEPPPWANDFLNKNAKWKEFKSGIHPGFFEEVKRYVQTSFCDQHNLPAVIEFADGGDVSLAKLAACCPSNRKAVLNTLQLLMKKWESTGIRSKIIIHSNNVMSPMPKELN